LSYSDSGPGQKRYALRGLQSAGEPEVALYYDEIPISGLPGGSLDTGNDQLDIKLWDVDRIEVLRGPQGTLYGNGSMGGAIRILSNRPDLNHFSTALETSASTTDGGADSSGYSVMLNAPLITGRLALRVTAYDRNEGGWIDSLPQPGTEVPQIDRDNLNWERTSGGRLSLALQATSQWKVTAVAYYQDTKTGEAWDLDPAVATPSDPYVTGAFIRTPWRDRASMYNLISDYDLGWSEFVETAAYQRRDVQQNLDTTRYLLGLLGCTTANWDQTCFTAPLIPADGAAFESVEAWSDEARLTSEGSGPLQWTLGAFAQNAITSRLSDVAKVGPAGYLQYDANGGLLNRLFSRSNYDTFDQYAVFGELSYEVIQHIKAIVGLREFRSDRTDQQDIIQQFFPGSPTGREPFQKFVESHLYKKFELSYDIDRNASVYLEAAQGFRAGGPNYPGGFNLTAPPYRSDSVWDYEFGWKVTAWRGALFWSGAAFHIDWSHVQQLVPTQNFSYIANAGSAASDGMETELSWNPSPGLTLRGGTTYNDVRLVGPQPIQADPTLQLSPGDRLANVPQWIANGAVSYRKQVGGGYTGSIQLEGFFESDRPDIVTTQNPGYVIIPSAKLLNLRLGLDSPRSWRLGLDIENLLDGYEPLSGQSLDGNYVRSVSAARPRTISLILDVTY
jgi:iron complex outermembrane receptor protein